MDEIAAIATRETTLNGRTIRKGGRVTLPRQQFDDLRPTRLFKEAGAKKIRRGKAR
jgi:hypothetical protein